MYLEITKHGSIVLGLPLLTIIEYHGAGHHPNYWEEIEAPPSNVNFGSEWADWVLKNLTIPSEGLYEQEYMELISSLNKSPYRWMDNHKFAFWDAFVFRLHELDKLEIIRG